MLTQYQLADDAEKNSWDEIWQQDGDSFDTLKQRCMQLNNSIRQLLKSHNDTTVSK